MQNDIESIPNTVDWASLLRNMFAFLRGVGSTRGRKLRCLYIV